jgi:hypothetical protein
MEKCSRGRGELESISKQVKTLNVEPRGHRREPPPAAHTHTHNHTVTKAAGFAMRLRIAWGV